MAYAQYFTNKTQNKQLSTDSDFISANNGDILEKTSGERFTKVDTNVFDKVAQEVINKTTADSIYASLATRNTFTNQNAFNANTNILQASFANVDHGNNVVHTQLSIPDVNVSHYAYADSMNIKTLNVTGSLTSGTNSFTNISVSNTTTSANITSSGTSKLATVTASGNVTGSASITGKQIVSTADTKVGTTLSVGTTSTFTGGVTCRSTLTATGRIYANGAIQTQNIVNPTSGGINAGNGNIGDSTHYYANVYATNFQGTALYAKAADLAEKYHTDIDYPAGTVLQYIEDENSEYELEKYTNGIVAGVVSTDPAVRMNCLEQGGWQYIALSGRVPVICDGDVKKGQFCVARDGKVFGVSRCDMSDVDPTFKDKIVGVAIANSENGKVLVKVNL